MGSESSFVPLIKFASQFQFETWNNNLHIPQLLTGRDNSSSDPTAQIMKGVENSHFRPTYIKPTPLDPFWKGEWLRSLPRNIGLHGAPPPQCGPQLYKHACIWICWINDNYKVTTSKGHSGKVNNIHVEHCSVCKEISTWKGHCAWRIPIPTMQEPIREWCYVPSLWIVFFSWSNDTYKPCHSLA